MASYGPVALSHGGVCHRLDGLQGCDFCAGLLPDELLDTWRTDVASMLEWGVLCDVDNRGPDL